MCKLGFDRKVALAFARLKDAYRTECHTELSIMINYSAKNQHCKLQLNTAEPSQLDKIEYFEWYSQLGI